MPLQPKSNFIAAVCAITLSAGTLMQDAPASAHSDKHQTQVMVLASLHGIHKDHPSYNYEVLYNLIEEFDPDYVGVEIRPEDMGADPDYLKRNYPREMIELSIKYGPEQAFGFDWLGDEINGMAIPADYWKTNHYIQTLRAMEQDEAFLAREPEKLADLQVLEMSILEDATPASLADGRYGAAVREIDALEQEWYAGSPYGYVLEFGIRRDAMIGERITEFINAHPGSRIVLVMGADHRTFAVENIRKALGDAVLLVEPPE